VGLDYTNTPDAELIGAATADAFAVIYDRHAEHLFRWARARVGDHAAARLRVSRALRRLNLAITGGNEQ
jgi:hypothetical protein